MSTLNPAKSAENSLLEQQPDPARIQAIIQKQRTYFATGATRPMAFRLQQLQKFKTLVTQHEAEIFAALKQDLNKSSFESYLTEIGIVLDEIGYMQKNLASLMKPKSVKTPLTSFPAKSLIQYEPYGMVLNIAPWNYPFQLSLAPIVGAIAAGNTVILKPSEYAAHTSNLLARLVAQYFDEAFFAVVEGGVAVNQALLAQKFDYIFFTGSVAVGKIVMRAASEYLTPVTLELGGKSPCIVDASADLALAAKRIVWGKTVNSGQTCIAPDYLLVHNSVKDALVTQINVASQEFFGENPLTSPDYPKMISQKHYQRVKGFLQDGTPVVGGQYDDDTAQLALTVLDGVTWDSPVMQEEIFGAILPMLTFNTLDEVVTAVTARPKPLALYLFANNPRVEDQILDNISFGGGCVNDTLMHLATHHMPFGGVGDSGMGAYHGDSSFYTFSHAKSVMKRGTWVDVPLRYPPYTDQKLSLIRKVVK